MSPFSSKMLCDAGIKGDVTVAPAKEAKRRFHTFCETFC